MILLHSLFTPTNTPSLLLSISVSDNTTENFVTTIVKSIADQGATIVIAAIVIIFFGVYLKNVLKRENELVYGIVPKLAEIKSTIEKLQTSFNESIGSHNTRTNQSMTSLERDTDVIKEGITEETALLRDISNRLRILENNYDILFKLVVAHNGGKIPTGIYADDDIIDDDNQ